MPQLTRTVTLAVPEDLYRDFEDNACDRTAAQRSDVRSLSGVRPQCRRRQGSVRDLQPWTWRGAATADFATTTCSRKCWMRRGLMFGDFHDLTIDVDLPTELNRFHLPKAVAARLQTLLDVKTPASLTTAEHDEAGRSVNLAEFLTCCGCARSE